MRDLGAARRGSHPPGAPRRARPLLWLVLPALFLLALLVLSTFWRRPTRIEVELATDRLAFTLGGTESREILDRSVAFSIEGWASLSFAAEALTVADPAQLIPGTSAEVPPRFPPDAWRAVPPTAPVRFACDDPAARLTLGSSDPAAPRLGLLDRLHFAPGSQVILEVSPGREPALGVEIATPQQLSLTLDPAVAEVELVADHAAPAGLVVPFPGDLLTWRARLPAARRTLDLASGPRGLVLLVTPARGRPEQLFRTPLDLPLAPGSAVELVEEDLEGPLASPLRDTATLRYPDFPEITAVTIAADEPLGLAGLSQARLRSLDFDAAKGALRARFEGVAGHAASRAGEQSRDHRLTLYHTLRYNWRWALLATVIAGLVPILWGAFELWKKLQE